MFGPRGDGIIPGYFLFIFMDENSAKQVREVWWKPAITVFANVSVWIVVPILAALFLGKYLDNKYETGSRYFLVLIALAFIITVAGILGILRKYMKKL